MQPQIRDRWRKRDGSRTARDGRGLRYQLDYEDLSGRSHSESFTLKKDAEARKAEVLYDLNRGWSHDPNDPTTVLTWIEKFLASKHVKAATAQRNESLIRIHVAGTEFGGRQIVKVRPSDAQAWVTDRASVLASSTLRILVTLVRGAFTAAVHDLMLRENRNPFQRVRLPKVERERVVPLTVEQVLAIVDKIAEPYKAMVITQAGLGLRIGELLALHEHDIDRLRRVVRIRNQTHPKTGELMDTKTRMSRRTVLLSDVVAHALDEHARKFPPTSSGLLFHTRRGLAGGEGRPISRDGYGNKAFVPAARAVGLPAGTTTHALRHHYASVQLAAGESVVAVAEWLGHDDASLVMSTYGHLMPSQEARGDVNVDAAWEAARSRSTGAIERTDGTMRVTDAIKRLTQALREHGDIEVVIHAPSAGGRGPVSLRAIVDNADTSDGPVVALTDGANLEAAPGRSWR